VAKKDAITDIVEDKQAKSIIVYHSKVLTKALMTKIFVVPHQFNILIIENRVEDCTPLKNP
jgi:hypothetical protein